MYNSGSAANGYAPTLGNPPWPTLINNLDIYNTQTVIVTGFLN
jgi:hypothetical protein